MPTFCRHNRFFADCPICSKGTVLDPARSAARRPSLGLVRAARGAPPRPAAGAPRASRGPFVAAGPYDGAEVRLERVPGGLRMASWRGGQIERAAPVLDAADAPGTARRGGRRRSCCPRRRARTARPRPRWARSAPARAAPGSCATSCAWSASTSGRIRVARWIMRPNRGWELQEAPVMLPPARFTQALAAAAGKGVLASGGPAE